VFEGLDLEGVEEGSRVTVLACGGIDAIVSGVPRESYEASRDESSPAELEWVVPRALRHDHVVRTAASRAPVLPARFGAVFSSEEAIARLVTYHENTIIEFIDLITGKAEWSVRAWYDPEAAADQLLAADPGLAARHARLPASSGARFFAEKRLREDARAAARGAARAAARAVRAGLASSDVCEVSLRRPDPSGREMILNLACLLDDSQAACQLATARDLALAAGPPGLEFEADGPWPAFHFCPALNLDGAA